MVFDYPLIWACLIAVAVLAYVILDGFDLGIGALFLLHPKKEDRDAMMESVAPVWDGNETWLVLGGGGLLAVFPLAYAIILPALYLPLIVMLLGLILRGVAFEFRPRSGDYRFLWDWSFAWGSIIAALAQGVALGALVHGIHVVGRGYGGGTWDWLSPFSALTGVALLVGYGLLGACWLIVKTTGPLRAMAQRQAKILAFATLLLIGVVSLWTPFINADYFTKWLAYPAVLYSAVVPLVLLGCAGLLVRGLTRDSDWLPFLASLGIFITCFGGLGISFYPYIVPTSVTLWQAAAPDISLRFLLVGTAVLLPMVLIYTGHAYWVFHGKVGNGSGYH